MFFKINKCIFIGVRMKAFTMQSKNKIGAWAHMRPPLSSVKPCSLTVHAGLSQTFSEPKVLVFSRTGSFII